jgi:hypothetical protein
VASALGLGSESEFLDQRREAIGKEGAGLVSQYLGEPAVGVNVLSAIDGPAAAGDRIPQLSRPPTRLIPKKKKKEGRLSDSFRSESSSPGRAISYSWRAAFRECFMQGRKSAKGL